MIEVEKLSKRYGSYEALKGITFKAKQGEIVGLLGPNGAGKTTTMRILTGYMPPTSGRVTIDGLDIVNDSAAVRARVGYMPERVPIYPDMTVESYVAFWARLRGVSNVRERVGVALERVHLQDRRRSLVRNLSKGMKQRLGLAQALVHEPQVIILDEPTIGIDPRQVIEVRDAVRELGRDHTVIFSTHILSEAEQVCDRVVILNRGEIIAQGKPDEMRRQLERGQSLYVAVGKVSAADAAKLLSGVQGVRAVEPQGAGFVLRVQQGVDVRANIAKRIHESSATLLELRPVAMTLEDIFLDLVERQEGRL